MTTWSTLGKLGRSKLVSYTVFIPIIGFFVLFNGQVTSFLELSSATLNISKEDLSLLSIKSLKNLYFGLSFLAFASITFKIFCPDSIQEYGNLDSYITSSIKYMDKQLCEELTEQTINNKHGKVNESIITALKEYDVVYVDPIKEKIPQSSLDHINSSLSHESWIRTHKMHFTSLLRTKFSQDEYTNNIARFFTVVFYFIGFSVIGYSSLKVFFTIFSTTFF